MCLHCQVKVNEVTGKTFHQLLFQVSLTNMCSRALREKERMKKKDVLHDLFLFTRDACAVLNMCVRLVHDVKCVHGGRRKNAV